jgi:hypothetical protein
MKFSTLVSAVFLILTPLVAAAPAKRANTGSYSVSGLGARKQAVIAAGGTDLDLAIAMMETEDMKATYAYGDNKSNDSFNAVSCFPFETA